MIRPDAEVHRLRVRARGRAMRRLADRYPGVFSRMMQEEEVILGLVPHDGPRHRPHGRFNQRKE